MRWGVEVRWGIGRGRVFVSHDVSDASVGGTKKGHAAAAAVALVGLESVINDTTSKPVKTVDVQFGGWFESTCLVLDGGRPDSWETFWQCDPKVVGIDVEGNLRTPPVLVQVCVETTRVASSSGNSFGNTLCILEVPRSNPGGGLSHDLQRLLRDRSIVKVFCDGTANADKRSLGVDDEMGNEMMTADTNRNPDTNRNFTRAAHIVDLETLATALAGPTSVPRGLARVVNLAWPDAPTRVVKDAADKSSVNFFINIERNSADPKRTPPPRAVCDLPKNVAKYAAMDAWLTLLGFRGLEDAARREGVAFSF